MVIHLRVVSDVIVRAVHVAERVRLFPCESIEPFGTSKEEMEKQSKREFGDEVLVLDWTKGVATRCGGFAVFKGMVGDASGCRG